MIRASGQTGVPVTIIADQVVIGFNRPRLEQIVALMAKGTAEPMGRKPLGAKVADASKYALSGGRAMSGAYVGGVNLGSPAEVAGLRAGDIITSVEGRAICSIDDLSKALRGAKSNQVKLSVTRGDQTRDVHVQL